MVWHGMLSSDKISMVGYCRLIIRLGLVWYCRVCSNDRIWYGIVWYTCYEMAR